MEVDSLNKVHIVYTTLDNKIAYLTYDGSLLSDVEIIDSTYDGDCKWPEISLDTNNRPHIVYVDSMGDSRGTKNQGDIMYAANNGAGFSKSLMYSGYYDSYDKYGTYPAEKPPLIAFDANNNRYIFYQTRSYSHGMSVYHDRSIQVVGNNTQSLGSVGLNTNRFDMYQLKVESDSVYALYRNGATVKLAQMDLDATQNLMAQLKG